MTREPEIVRWTWATRVTMLLVTLVGIVTFCWPFAATSRAQLSAGNDAPWLFPVLVGLLALVLLAQIARGGMDAKAVALLGVLAALGGALRVLSTGVAGLEPMFFLLVLGGRVLGRAGGFLLGATAMLTGAFLTGGIGPWLPYQMLAAGWVGLGAALLPAVAPRAERWLLAAYAASASMAYGLVMTLWFWPFLTDGTPAGAGFEPGVPTSTQLRHLGLYYVLTSLGWDVPRAVLNTVLVLLAGPAVLAALRRGVRRGGFAPRVPASTAGQPDGSVNGDLSPVTVTADDQRHRTVRHSSGGDGGRPWGDGSETR